MTGFLSGCATALITPFTQTGVDLASLECILDYQIAGGADAVVILGTTGEPSTMSEDEKRSVIVCAKKKLDGRAKLIVGTGGNNTAKAVCFSREAEELGADALLAVTPYYNKCTQAGLFNYYESLCGAVSIPVIAYNVPSRTGLNLLPETAARIAELPNLAGIKEASGNMAQFMDTALAVRGKCDLYSGEDALNLPILCAGGTAVISVVSNLAPAAVKALTEAVKAGDLQEARRLSDALLPLAKACFTEVNPIPVKAGMEMLGFRTGDPRPPLTPLEEGHRAILRKAMEDFGLGRAV